MSGRTAVQQSRGRHPARERGPTNAPPPGTPKRWPERKWAARLIRLVVFVVPILLSFVVAVVLSRRVATTDVFWIRVLRWLAIAAVATVTMLVAQRAMRRLLPLAALFSLTLVFPDETPSRFGLALRGMSARQLEKKLAEVDDVGHIDLGDTPTEAAESLLEMVAGLSQHDRLTRGHSERVRAYAVMIGEEMELDAAEIDHLRWAALLHDVGKLYVPAEILNKPGALTPEEFETVKQHTVAGKEMVAPLAPWLGASANAVYEHHERWVGGGYPLGVPSEQLALTSRIVSVADAFDVMTSARSYKDPMSAKDARAELQRCAGTQFDPEVVRAMMNISLGKLWRAMGPLAWAAQIGLFPRPVAQAGPAAAAVVAALMSLLISGLALAADRREAVLDERAEIVEVPPPADDGEGGGGDAAAASGSASAPAVAAAGPTTTSTTTTTTSTTTTTTTSTTPPVVLPPVISTTTTTTRPPTTRPPSTPTTSRPAPSPIVTLPPATTVATTTTVAPATTAATTTTVAPTTTAATTTTTVAPTTTAATTTTTVAPTTTAATTTTTSTTSTLPPTTTSTSTTTSTPTSTTTSTSTTTTTLPPDPTVFVLGSPGAGDQPSQPVLDLVGDRPPQNALLPNYDTDRNADPGLTIVGSPGTMITSNPAGVQVWRFPDSFTTIDGTVALELWVAPVGPPTPGQFRVRAGFFDCDLARTSCTRIVRDTLTLDGTDGVFAPVTFDLTIGAPYIADPGRRLELRYATLNGSSNDSWIAYDSADAPAQLVITPPAGSSGGVVSASLSGDRPAWPVAPIALLAVAFAAVVTARQPGRRAAPAVGRLAVPTGG